MAKWCKELQYFFQKSNQVFAHKNFKLRKWSQNIATDQITVTPLSSVQFSILSDFLILLK